MAPIIGALQADKEFETKVCVTGQHREMLDQGLALFDLHPDFDLDIMRQAQRLTDIASRTIDRLADLLEHYRPDYALVEGDTTTAMAAALAAFYNGVKVGHIEAGLRTQNLYSPWPEEANRRIIGVLAHRHFAPTEAARDNLLREGVPNERITVCGNTVVDALLSVAALIDRSPDRLKECHWAVRELINFEKRVILVTGHRRENFGRGLERVFRALATIAQKRPELQIVYPVHLNPNVQKPAKEILRGVPNVFLTDPLDYLSFVYVMKNSFCIITDSGGIQEEAPILGKPLLITRENTERPEAVLAGTGILVGTDERRIVHEVDRLLDDPEHYQLMSRKHNALGDGHAAEYIVTALKNAED
jgi:UDP-N-acetylglucosamine 2-epimerase (non-hydrolysing)